MAAALSVNSYFQPLCKPLCALSTLKTYPELHSLLWNGSSTSRAFLPWEAQTWTQDSRADLPSAQYSGVTLPGCCLPCKILVPKWSLWLPVEFGHLSHTSPSIPLHSAILHSTIYKFLQLFTLLHSEVSNWCPVLFHGLFSLLNLKPVPSCQLADLNRSTVNSVPHIFYFFFYKVLPFKDLEKLLSFVGIFHCFWIISSDSNMTLWEIMSIFCYLNRNWRYCLENN